MNKLKLTIAFTAGLLIGIITVSFGVSQLIQPMQQQRPQKRIIKVYEDGSYLYETASGEILSGCYESWGLCAD